MKKLAMILAIAFLSACGGNSGMTPPTTTVMKTTQAQVVTPAPVKTFIVCPPDSTCPLRSDTIPPPKLPALLVVETPTPPFNPFPKPSNDIPTGPENPYPVLAVEIRPSPSPTCIVCGTIDLTATVGGAVVPFGTGPALVTDPCPKNVLCNAQPINLTTDR